MINKDNKLIIERLTALWALNECGLGGFMHALSSPFTGILVGGISILLISLIALYAKNITQSLIKALCIVLLVKLSVSPHSPLTAYVAVSFQAFLGMFLYGLFSANKVTIVLLGTLTFLESALQKLLTLTIIYGQTLWDAVNMYTIWLSKELSFLHLELSSKTMIIAYLVFYASSGLVVGLLIVRTIKLIHVINVSQQPIFQRDVDKKEYKKNTLFSSRKMLLFWAFTLTLIMLPFVFLSNGTGGWQTGLYLIARSFLVLILWYIILGPLFLKGLNKFLSKKQTNYQSDIQNTLELFPHLKSIIRYAWHDSKSFKGINRMQHFLANSIVYSVHHNPFEE